MSRQERAHLMDRFRDHVSRGTIAPDVKLGTGVKIYGFVNLYGCEIGGGTKIGSFVEIQKGVRVGRKCKISSHSFLCEGVTIEDAVFIGHNVTFTNDRYPQAVTADGRLKDASDWSCIATLVKTRASIGSGSTILCGVTIGAHAMVGAGSVVTRDIPGGAIVAGNPARVLRWVEDLKPSGPDPDSRPIFFDETRDGPGRNFR